MRVLPRRGDRIELIHARGIEPAEAATIRSRKLHFVDSRPRVVVGKTAGQLVRFGAATGNHSLIREIARWTRRCIARHRYRIRRRRTNVRPIVRKDERRHVHVHETETTRITHRGPLNQIRPIRVAHHDFNLTRRTASITRCRIAVVARFARIEV